MLNDNKTEFFVIGSCQQLAKVNINHIHVGSSEIKPASSVRTYYLLKVAPYIFSSLEPLSFNGGIETLCNNKWQ